MPSKVTVLWTFLGWKINYVLFVFSSGRKFHYCLGFAKNGWKHVKRHTSFRRTTFRPLKSMDVLLCIEKNPNLKHMLSYASQIGRKINIWNHHHLVEIPWRQQRWNPCRLKIPQSTCGSGKRPQTFYETPRQRLLQRFPWWTSQPTLKRFPPKNMGQRKGSVIDLAKSYPLGQSYNTDFRREGKMPTRWAGSIWGEPSLITRMDELADWETCRKITAKYQIRTSFITWLQFQIYVVHF